MLIDPKEAKFRAILQSQGGETVATEESKGFLGRVREKTKDIGVKEIVEGAKEGFSGAVERSQARTGQLRKERMEGETGIADVGRAAAEPVVGGLDLVLSTLGGGFGALVEPVAEEAMAALPEGAKEKIVDLQAQYESLDPKTKQDVQRFLVGVEALGTVVGGAGVKRVGKELVEETIKPGAALAKEIAPDIKEMATDAIAPLKDLSPTQLKQRMGVAIEESAKNDLSEFIKSKKSLINKAQDLQTKKNIDVVEELSDPSILKGIKVQDGSIVPDEATELLQSRTDKLMEIKQELLPEISSQAPRITRADLEARAIEDIKGKFPPAEEKKIIQAIKNQVDELPESMTVIEVDEHRAKFRRSGRDAKGLQKEANQFAALENATRNAVFDATDAVAINNAGDFAALNDQIRRNIELQDFLNKTLRGQKVKGGRLTGLFGRTIGAVAGASSGPLGVLAGSEIGARIVNILTNNQLGNSLKLRLVKGLTDDPEVLKNAEAMLEQVKGLSE